MIDILDSTFSYIVDSLLYNCSIRGVKMVAYEKFRNPQTQAVYWKQGRTKDEVTLAIKLLQKDKAFYLIDCIESAEHRDGIIITNALPGLSWHQLEKR